MTERQLKAIIVDSAVKTGERNEAEQPHSLIKYAAALKVQCVGFSCI